jgi:toxin ParE1/3/4
MGFKIKLNLDARNDIQNNIDWYNEQQKNLGKKFLDEIKTYIQKLKSIPFFQIRYDNVRCLPLKKFPFMIHYTIDEDEKVIIIRAILNTHRDPSIWKDRK